MLCKFEKHEYSGPSLLLATDNSYNMSCFSKLQPSSLSVTFQRILSHGLQTAFGLPSVSASPVDFFPCGLLSLWTSSHSAAQVKLPGLFSFLLSRVGNTNPSAASAASLKAPLTFPVTTPESWIPLPLTLVLSRDLSCLAQGRGLPFLTLTLKWSVNVLSSFFFPASHALQPHQRSRVQAMGAFKWRHLGKGEAMLIKNQP